MKLTIMAIVTALVVSLAAFTTMAQTATPTPEPTGCRDACTNTYVHGDT